jgi:putative Holliday junction resolvase
MISLKVAEQMHRKPLQLFLQSQITSAESSLMRGRRIAFDYGDVRTGVAVSDPDGILASPVGALATKTKGFSEEISALLEEYQPIAIYVGLPLHLSGVEGESVEKVRAFISQIQGLTAVQIVEIDERLSTSGAQKRLKEAGVSSRDSKGLIDSMAAVAILEAGLQSEKG